MNLLDYIQGVRKGKDAHHIEREAMKDPFLSEALDGYESVAGNHADRIKRMQELIDRKTRSQINRLRIWGIAASILVCISIGGYFFIHEQKKDLLSYSHEEKNAKPTNAPNPDSEKLTQNEAQREPLFEEKVKPAEPTKMQQSSPKKVEAEKIKAADEMLVQEEKPVEASQVYIEKTAELSKSESKKDSEEATALGFLSTKDILHNKSVSAKEQKVMTKSEPVIGSEAYQTYLKENLIRPIGKCAKTKGTVVLEFMVDVNGNPTDIQVKKSICQETDQEAIRLLKEGCRWTPGIEKIELKVTF